MTTQLTQEDIQLLASLTFSVSTQQGHGERFYGVEVSSSTSGINDYYFEGAQEKLADRLNALVAKLRSA